MLSEFLMTTYLPTALIFILQASTKKSRFKGFANLLSLGGGRGGGNENDAKFLHMRYNPPLKDALEKLIRGQVCVCVRVSLNNPRSRELS